MYTLSHSLSLSHTHTDRHTHRCGTSAASQCPAVGLGSCERTWNCRHWPCERREREGKRRGGRGGGEKKGEGAKERRGNKIGEEGENEIQLRGGELS
jgi:hypothetical protein